MTMSNPAANTAFVDEWTSFPSSGNNNHRAVAAAAAAAAAIPFSSGDGFEGIPQDSMHSVQTAQTSNHSVKSKKQRPEDVFETDPLWMSGSNQGTSSQQELDPTWNPSALVWPNMEQPTTTTTTKKQPDVVASIPTATATSTTKKKKKAPSATSNNNVLRSPRRGPLPHLDGPITPISRGSRKVSGTPSMPKLRKSMLDDDNDDDGNEADDDHDDDEGDRVNGPSQRHPPSPVWEQDDMRRGWPKGMPNHNSEMGPQVDDEDDHEFYPGQATAHSSSSKKKSSKSGDKKKKKKKKPSSSSTSSNNENNPNAQDDAGKKSKSSQKKGSSKPNHQLEMLQESWGADAAPSPESNKVSKKVDVPPNGPSPDIPMPPLVQPDRNNSINNNSINNNAATTTSKQKKGDDGRAWGPMLSKAPPTPMEKPEILKWDPNMNAPTFGSDKPDMHFEDGFPRPQVFRAPKQTTGEAPEENQEPNVGPVGVDAANRGAPEENQFEILAHGNQYPGFDGQIRRNTSKGSNLSRSTNTRSGNGSVMSRAVSFRSTQTDCTWQSSRTLVAGVPIGLRKPTPQTRSKPGEEDSITVITEAPPLSTIKVCIEKDENEEGGDDDALRMMTGESGETLEGYLQRVGQDGELAEATAAAFHAFMEEKKKKREERKRDEKPYTDPLLEAYQKEPPEGGNWSSCDEVSEYDSDQDVFSLKEQEIVLDPYSHDMDASTLGGSSLPPEQYSSWERVGNNSYRSGNYGQFYPTIHEDHEQDQAAPSRGRHSVPHPHDMNYQRHMPPPQGYYPPHPPHDQIDYRLSHPYPPHGPPPGRGGYPPPPGEYYDDPYERDHSSGPNLNQNQSSPPPPPPPPHGMSSPPPHVLSPKMGAGVVGGHPLMSSYRGPASQAGSSTGGLGANNGSSPYYHDESLAPSSMDGENMRMNPPNMMGMSQGSIGSHKPPVARITTGAISVASSLDKSTLQQQMLALTIDERRVVSTLRDRWESRSNRIPFPPDWYLRFARCSPGRPFTVDSAWKVMKKFDMRYLNLSIVMMEQQLLTKTLFPVWGLQSMDGHQMFYMRPSRYFPRDKSSNVVIDNLVYVMQCMMENEQCIRNGIGFVANMTDWKMVNFKVSYWNKLMSTLQGQRVPTRVQIFLIVNPPPWFGSIWAIMRPMMSDAFRKKVHTVSMDEMKNHLAPGFEQYLPDDMMRYGRANTDVIVRSFIEERKHIESQRIMAWSDM